MSDHEDKSPPTPTDAEFPRTTAALVAYASKMRRQRDELLAMVRELLGALTRVRALVNAGPVEEATRARALIARIEGET